MTDMSQLFFDRGHIAVGRQRSRTCTGCLVKPSTSTRTYRGGTSALSRTWVRCYLVQQVQRGHIALGRQLGHDHGEYVSFSRSVRRGHNAVGYQLGHGLQSDVESANAWKSKFHNCGYHGSSLTRRAARLHPTVSSGLTSVHPPRGFADDACDRPPHPQRRRRQLHRHPRERHVLRPHVQPGYVLQGVTSCTTGC